jgi:hypothetical protein
VKLYAGRWSADGATVYPDSAMLAPEQVGANWRVDNYGVQLIQVTVKARNKYDQYDRYKNHLGQRLAIYGSDCYRPISGYIVAVEYAGAGRVTYTAKGPGAARMQDELYTTVQPTSRELDNIIKAVLTASVSVSSSDQSNIDNNTTTLSGWQPAYPQGSYPRDVIADVLEMADSSGNIWDFWFKDAPFDGVLLGDYVPFYKARSTSANADWVVWRRDLSQITLARDINDIVSDASVYYGVITGTHDGADNSPYLQDSATNFLTAGVRPGDRVTNITDEGRATAARIPDSNNNRVNLDGLSGGTDNDFDDGDTYSIQSQDYMGVQTDNVTSDYWDREVAVFERGMTSTQASQYAAILANVGPRQVQSFTVGAPLIRSASGARFPLWDVIAQGGGYIRVADLYPAAALFDTSSDKLTTFRITGLDYDYARNQLAVTVQDPSLRLDARLRRAGILGSEMIQRG